MQKNKEKSPLLQELGLVTAGSSIAGLGGFGLGKLADTIATAQFDFNIFHILNPGNLNERALHAFLDFTKQDAPSIALHLLSGLCWTVGLTILAIGTVQIINSLFKEASEKRRFGEKK